MTLKSRMKTSKESSDKANVDPVFAGHKNLSYARSKTPQIKTLQTLSKPPGLQSRQRFHFNGLYGIEGFGK